MKYLMISPGLCVQPTMEKPELHEYVRNIHGDEAYRDDMREYEQHLESSPKLPTTCTLKEGEWFDGREQKQWRAGEGYSFFSGDLDYDQSEPKDRRIVIVPVEQKSLSFIVGKLYQPFGHFIMYKNLPNGKTEYVFSDCGQLDTYNREQVEPLAEAPDVPVEQKDVEAVCQKCGGHNPVWSAENDLFNEVNGSPYGIMCPVCFDKMAREKGISPYYRATKEIPVKRQSLKQSDAVELVKLAFSEGYDSAMHHENFDKAWKEFKKEHNL